MLTGKTIMHTSGHRRVLYLPKVIYADSQFPFIKGDNLEMSIVGDTLVIKKRGEGEPEAPI